MALAVSCSGEKSGGGSEADSTQVTLNEKGEVVEGGKAAGIEALPFSGADIREHVVLDFGKRTLRTDPDESLSFPDLVKNRDHLFIVMSKKDYYLYVYEDQGNDTVLIARYDCAFALRKGQKEVQGDMRTPHCTEQTPAFSISEIKDASTWAHDFGDGRGSIPAYGAYFLRLNIGTSNRSIGIHGSTNNRESVPGRASEGCIRLKDEDIQELAELYARQGMSVIIKAEDVDDYPFEIKAMQKQEIERKRHFVPGKTLTNEQIDKAATEPGRTAGAAPEPAPAPETGGATRPSGPEPAQPQPAATQPSGNLSENISLEQLKQQQN